MNHFNHRKGKMTMPETESTTPATESVAPPKALKSRRGPKPPDSPKVLTITSAAVSKGNVYRLPPSAILVPKEMNGRKYGSTDTKDLIRDFLNPDVGQLQPIGVRQTKDGVAVAYGFRRHAAALEIEEMGLAKSGESFLIDCILVKGDDDAAYTKNVLENIQRQSTTPIDDAYNIDRLTTEFGKSREEVGKLYGKGGKPRSASWISQTLKLLTLPADIQKKIHSGEIGVAAAYELASADEETREEVVKAAKAKGGRVTREAVSEARREAAEKAPKAGKAKGGKGKTAKPKKGRTPSEERGRSRKEVQVFFTQLANLVETNPTMAEQDKEGQTVELGKQFLAWLGGKGTNKTRCRRLMKYGALVE
jgi:ParB family chromosome partitioning protein